MRKVTKWLIVVEARLVVPLRVAAAVVIVLVSALAGLIARDPALVAQCGLAAGRILSGW